MPRIGIVGFVVLSHLSMAVAQGADPASDGQPSDSPYFYKTVKRQEFGDGARSYWIFEPADPVPESAPVVVFNHGWLAVNPGAYGAWIDHLVRRGNIVIFPRYQFDVITRPSDFLPNALAAIRDGLDVLATSPKHVKPDLKRFALIGHSAGGNLSAQIAAIAHENLLPTPRAVLALMPGEVQPMQEPKLSQIPPSTLLVVTVGEDDRVVGDVRGRQIFTEASAIPKSRKKFILYRTDLHGHPRLIADHFAPTGTFRSFDTGDGIFRNLQMIRGDVNAFDRAGFWRLADITLEAAFRGMTLDEATADGAILRHLGYWSDGRPVERPIVSDDLASVPRVFPTNGIRLIKWTMKNATDDSTKVKK